MHSYLEYIWDSALRTGEGQQALLLIAAHRHSYTLAPPPPLPSPYSFLLVLNCITFIPPCTQISMEGICDRIPLLKLGLLKSLIPTGTTRLAHPTATTQLSLELVELHVDSNY